MSKKLLSSLPLFEGLGKADLELLANLVQREDHERDTAVFEQGARAHKLYIVISGKVEVRFKPEDGEILVVASLERGGVFGWSAALGRRRYTSCAVTVEDSELLSIRGDELRELCESNPQTGVLILERLAGVIAERLRSTHTHVVAMLHQGMQVDKVSR
jgi:toluene monooxygenase system ferredoxin subunit